MHLEDGGQVVDKALLSHVPTRADRCAYIMYGSTPKTPLRLSGSQATLEEAIETLMDPVARNNAQGRRPHGFVCLHWTICSWAVTRCFKTRS